MNDKLVQLHDGELGNDEATRMRASLTEEAADRALLDAMDRVDRTLVEVDRLIGPGAERIESGKQALKAILRTKVNGHEPRRARAVFRRPVFAAVGGALAAAAALAIWVAWPAAGVIGTVRYDVPENLRLGKRSAVLRLEEAVRAPWEGEADIDVPGVFQMRLSKGGEVKIGRRASEVRWISGRVTFQAFADVTLRLGDTAYSVVSRPNSIAQLRTFTEYIELAQQSGTSVVVAGGQRQTVEAGTTVRLDLGRSSLTESDGPEQ
ncbi:MAG TPA: hypothetical protein VMZ31_03110 [Phycisphaerae bacterium]|nr:hypothetical protein [Phycisphaerae bacterium]